MARETLVREVPGRRISGAQRACAGRAERPLGCTLRLPRAILGEAHPPNPVKERIVARCNRGDPCAVRMKDRNGLFGQEQGP